MIPQFALRLIVGLCLTWRLLPQALITSGFFRIQMLLALGLCVLAALTAPQWSELESGTGAIGLATGQGLLAAGGAIAFVGSVLWTLERRRGGAIAGLLLLVLTGGVLLGTIPIGTEDRGPLWLQVLDRASSASLLGGMTAAMLLGHWYLTATGMSLAPLQRATRLAQGAALLRFISAAAGTLLAPPEVRARLLGAHLAWTLLRWGAGLAGPLVLALMTPGTLKYRNTQSATGVLFAAVILTFIGEAAALLLAAEFHWPL